MGTSSSEFCQRTSFSFVLTSCSNMWLLLFICLSTASSVPITSTQQPAGPGSGGGTTSSQNVTTPAQADGVTLNETQTTTGPASGHAVSLHGFTQEQNAETNEELQEDMFVLIDEGDILMPVDRNAVKSLWPEATVPYTISKDLAQRESDVLAAFKMISDVTCIRFKPLGDEFSYLKFRTGKGCASFVGCQGGAQSVFYSESCSVGNLCHEIVHALGLHHEHTRKDRDQHVTVEWNSIMSGRQKNFKMKGGDTLDLPYDLDSIMHYGKYFFSKNGSPTVVPKNGGTQIGQRTHLSRLDIRKLNRLYHCD